MYSGACMYSGVQKPLYIPFRGNSGYLGMERRLYESVSLPSFEPVVPASWLSYGRSSYARHYGNYSWYSGKSADGDGGRVSAHLSEPEVFLKPFRPSAQFIDDAEGIMEQVVSAFKECVGCDFPDDMVLRVCSPEEMASRYRNWHPGVVGFSFNRLGFGVSEIFLLRNHFDSLIVTAGHEIGHVLSFPAPTRIAEEAKAFAFEAAWLRTLVDRDIGGLSGSISLAAFSPAINGIHNVAFGIVKSQLLSGRQPMELYSELARGKATAL